MQGIWNKQDYINMAKAYVYNSTKKSKALVALMAVVNKWDGKCINKNFEEDFKKEARLEGVEKIWIEGNWNYIHVLDGSSYESTRGFYNRVDDYIYIGEQLVLDGKRINADATRANIKVLLQNLMDDRVDVSFECTEELNEKVDDYRRLRKELEQVREKMTPLLRMCIEGIS